MATGLGNSDTAPSTPVLDEPVRPTTVLLVSTREAALDSCARRLEAIGFRTTTARTGFEAIVKACWHLPDVILLQDGLAAHEGVDGTVAAHLIRICPATAHIPIVGAETVDRLSAMDVAPPHSALLAEVARELSGE